MGTVFVHTLKRMRGALLGWGLSLAGLVVLFMSFYDDLAAQGAAMTELMKSYPPEVLALFGSVWDLASPQGFLGMYFFSYMPLILGIFAVLAGAGLLLQDEEDGVLDLLLAHPISRTQMFVGRLLGLMAVIAGILLLSYLTMLISMQWTQMELTAADLARPFIALYVQIFFLSTFPLMLSLLMPGRTTAAMTSGLLLVIAYFVNSLSMEVDGLHPAARFTPMHYYQGGEAIAEPLKWNYLLGLLALAAIFLLVAWWRWQGRDIRVSGEDVWSWRGLLARFGGGV